MGGDVLLLAVPISLDISQDHLFSHTEVNFHEQGPDIWAELNANFGALWCIHW